MAERFKVRRVPHYEVIDTQFEEEGKYGHEVHFDSKDQDDSQAYCTQKNEEHQYRLDAGEALHAQTLEFAEDGVGDEKT